MKNLDRSFGWMGAICLLLIIPIKVIRWANGGISDILIGIAPSLLTCRTAVPASL